MMRKLGLLTSIGVFALLMGGCTKNVESIPVEDSSDVVSEISEVQNEMPEPAEQDTELFGQDTVVPEQVVELSEQDMELINMAIHDNEHNIYMGSMGNEEIRMIISRIGDNLSAAYITRDDGEKIFQGELKKDSAGFILNTYSDDYLEGTISPDGNGGISINGEGVISESNVVFTLNQDTFFPIGEDLENYYFSLGYNADEAEQFAQQIKDFINDKTAFAGLIQYPISIEMDHGMAMIENEESMINIYDQLMEELNGFKEEIENIYTKYMFANYMGICVDDGIVWFSVDSSGDYKIIAINPPQYSLIPIVEPADGINQELENLMTLFYTAYFNKDIDTIEQYLTEGYQGDVSVVGSEIGSLEDVEIIEVKGWENAINKDSIGDKCELSLEFKYSNEDSYTYLTVDFIKEDSGWKITWYGLEK